MGAAALVIQVIQNPRTASILVCILLNLILLGFGFWWNAWALVAFAAVVSVSLGLAWLNEKILGLGAIITTIFWLVPAVCGVIGVTAFRCLRSCGGATGNSPFPTSTEMGNCATGVCQYFTNVESFAWTVDVPWYLSFAEGVVDWFVAIINAIPEGICWLNMFLGTIFLIISIFYWDFGNIFGGGGTGTSADDGLPRPNMLNIEPTFARMPLIKLPNVQPLRPLLALRTWERVSVSDA